MLLHSQYIKYILYFLIGSIINITCVSKAQETGQFYIGKNTTGNIGYLRIQNRPINQVYAVLAIKNIQCGNFIKGYAERQANRFILRTDILDPTKDDDHQCQITFIQKNQEIFVTQEKNCAKEHEMGCSFSSMIFSPTNISLSGQ